VDAAFDLPRDDDTPPPSGVRRRVVALHAGTPLPPYENPDVLVEVAEEVFFEVWGVVRALSPLQGAWLNLGLGQLGAAALTTALWRGSPRRLLRERWPELVPGYAAMDKLADVMVDTLC
jgi:hypothetical protein